MSRYLVWLGALNTSLILLLGPFAQQSVTLPLQPKNETLATASMPIKTQYQSNTFAQILRRSTTALSVVSHIFEVRKKLVLVFAD